MRCFVAVELPWEIRQRLKAVQEDFEDDGIRLVKDGALHVTLSFLGDINEGDAERVKEGLSEVKCAPFMVSCAGLGFFSPRRINVIFAKLQGGTGLSTLHEGVSEAVNKSAGIMEERGYVPHVTIARVHWANRMGLERRIMEYGSTEFGRFEVGSFYLKRSTLTGDGPVYETLREYRLEG